MHLIFDTDALCFYGQHRRSDRKIAKTSQHLIFDIDASSTKLFEWSGFICVVVNSEKIVSIKTFGGLCNNIINHIFYIPCFFKDFELPVCTRTIFQNVKDIFNLFS